MFLPGVVAVFLPNAPWQSASTSSSLAAFDPYPTGMPSATAPYPGIDRASQYERWRSVVINGPAPSVTALPGQQSTCAYGHEELAKRSDEAVELAAMLRDEAEPASDTASLDPRSHWKDYSDISLTPTAVTSTLVDSTSIGATHVTIGRPTSLITTVPSSLTTDVPLLLEPSSSHGGTPSFPPGTTSTSTHDAPTSTSRGTIDTSSSSTAGTLSHGTTTLSKTVDDLPLLRPTTSPARFSRLTVTETYVFEINTVTTTGGGATKTFVQTLERPLSPSLGSSTASRTSPASHKSSSSHKHSRPHIFTHTQLMISPTSTKGKQSSHVRSSPTLSLHAISTESRIDTSGLPLVSSRTIHADEAASTSGKHSTQSLLPTTFVHANQAESTRARGIGYEKIAWAAAALVGLLGFVFVL